MQFNLIQNIKGQARRLQKTIQNMSPKVQEVVGYNTQKIDKGMIQKKLTKFTSDVENSKILQERISALLKDRDSKEALYKQQDKLSKESIYDTLLDYFMEDTFGIDPDDKVVSVEILDDDTDLRTLMEVFPEDLMERTDLDEILTNNLKDTFLKYGELFLRKVYTQKIVTSLELLEGQYVYPVCNASTILFYIIINPILEDFEIVDPKEILAFQLNPKTKKIISGDSKLEKMLAEESDEFKAQIPNSYRVGTPLLYNARNELTKLRLASLLSDLAQVKQLAMPTLLAVNVENIRDEEQLSELLDVYEEYLEDAVQVPDLDSDTDDGDVDLESLLNTTVKAIPVEGSGKNGLTSLDIGFGSNTDDSYLDKKKEAVALAAGFPLSAVTVQSDNTSKADLSSNRRYRNKCKAGQRFIVRPIREWVLEDYEAQGIDVSPEQVRVFCKPIVSLDTAEDLEIALGAITQASQVYEALLTISDNSNDYTIDEDGYYDYFGELLGSFKGAKKLLKKRIEEAEEDPLLGDEPPAPQNRRPIKNVGDTDIDIDTTTETPESTDRLERVGVEFPQGTGAELTESPEEGI